MAQWPITCAQPLVRSLSCRCDAASLYEKLEQAVLPAYYGERRAWIGIMKGAIAKCGSLFNSHRMMRRYGVEAYLEEVPAVRNALC